MPFTDKQVNAYRPKASRYEIREPGRTGLTLRVTPDGIKTWCFRYRFSGGHGRLLFGTYPAVSLADVRMKLADAKKKLESGIDPGAKHAEQRHTERTAPMITHVAEAYLAVCPRGPIAPPRPKRTRILQREVIPVWRHRRAKDITRRDVMDLLNGVEEQGVYVLRNRVAGVLSRFFWYGLDQGYLDASPAFKIKRLKKVGQKEVEKPRTRVLSQDEMRVLGRPGHYPRHALHARGLAVALVTGQRRGEAGRDRRRRPPVDDPEGAGPRMAGNNSCPLPKLALSLLANADQARVRPHPTRPNRKDRRPYDPTPSPWLFPSARHDRPVTPAALTYAIIRHRKALGIGDATIHDLRRSFATWHGELGTPPDVVSALLNHAPTTITMQVYDHSLGLEPKRQAMEQWSAWLGRVLGGTPPDTKVVPMQRRRPRKALTATATQRHTQTSHANKPSGGDAVSQVRE